MPSRDTDLRGEVYGRPTMLRMRNRSLLLIPAGMLWGSALLLAGCETLPATTTTGGIHYVHISDRVEPRELRVGAGDEVRWVNERSAPVRLGFLGHTDLSDVSCARGFQHWGRVEDMVTIKPQDYVSLCFSQTGKVSYNVWWDDVDPRHAVSRTATIQISLAPGPGLLTG
jgi:plastocyanin